MRLQPIPSPAVDITAPQSAGTLEQRFILFGGAALLLLLALLLPEYAQTAHYHAFADQRSLAGLPHAADVLSNLGFVLMGVLGLRGTVFNLRREIKRLKRHGASSKDMGDELKDDVADNLHL